MTATDAFDTLAVHAGAEPDELTGRRRAADLPDRDVRPGRRRAAARRLRVRPRRRTRPASGSSGRSPPSRAARHGIAFASGSAATAAIAQLAAPGDEIVVGDDVYGGTFRYLERVHRPSGVETRYADLAAGPGRALGGAHRADARSSGSRRRRTRCSRSSTSRRSRAVVGERAAQSGGGRPLIVVDNTFASPALQRPLELGADIVFHSATKYLAAATPTRVRGVVVTNDDAIAERLRFLQNAMGARARAARLLPRPARAAHAALGRAHRNALAAANSWRRRRGRSFPRARDGPTHLGQVAARQMRSAAGMVSFVPRPGGPHGRDARERAIAICEGVRLFTLAESLGGVESLIELPAVMTHLSVAGTAARGRPEALIRLSVGIEAADDLIADLARALDAA